MQETEIIKEHKIEYTSFCIIMEVMPMFSQSNYRDNLISGQGNTDHKTGISETNLTERKVIL